MFFDVSMFGEYVRTALNFFAIGTFATIGLLWMTGWLKPIIRWFFGDLSDEEIEKFSILSLCFGVIIGVYWMMRVLKDPVFYELVGRQYVPYAKIITPVMLFIVLFAYGKLVDMFKRHRLFMVVCTFYALLFALVGILWKLNLPEITSPLVSWIPGKFYGWLFYIGVETFGGILVGAVFLAFVNSTTKTVSAKKGYALVYTGAQIGNFVGPAFNTAYAKVLGNVNLIFIAAAMIMLIPIIIEIYMKVIPPHMHEGDDAGHAKKKKTGAWEGLRLIATQPFLIGVLVVSTFYEVVSTIVDLQFKFKASDVYTKEEMTVFMGMYAMCAALVALTFTVMGTSFFIRQIGVRKSLLVYPILTAGTVVSVWLYPTLGVLFVAMIVIKAFSYALNSPVKELLYLPTSKDVKYKAKSFIDGFGSKGAKAAGASVVAVFSGNVANLIRMGGAVSLGIVGIWFAVAMMLGVKYDSLVENKEIIE